MKICFKFLPNLYLLAVLIALAYVPHAHAQSGICDRNLQVRNAILDRLGLDMTACAEVTEDNLNSLAGELTVMGTFLPLNEGDFDNLGSLKTLNFFGNEAVNLPAGIFDALDSLETLDVSDNGLSSLPAGIFDALDSLETLDLTSNRLSSLPEGIFNNLGSLATLNLQLNQLSRLPEGIFNNLDSLATLILRDNQLSSLPAGIFDSLGSLTTLNLENNELSSLPAGIFNNLDSLATLILRDNQLSSLPAGIFERLTSLETIDLSDNPGTDSFKPSANAGSDRTTTVGEVVRLDATATDGGPFGSNLSFAWLQDGSDSTTVTLTGAATATPTFTVPADTPDGTVFQFDLTVVGGNKFETLNDSSRQRLTDSDSVAVTAIARAGFGICDRTSQVQEAILDALFPDVVSCAEVTTTHLESIISLDLSFRNISELDSNDLNGLTALSMLPLSNNPSLMTLPAGVFDGLSTLSELYLQSNNLTTLTTVVFNDLTALERLDLGDNDLTTLPAGVFGSLTRLTELRLNQNNQLTMLPAGVFDSLIALKELDLGENNLTTLPDGVFDGLARLELLYLDQTQLTMLPAGVFDSLTMLRLLHLDDNQLEMLPDDVFEPLTSLTSITLFNNPGSESFKPIANAGPDRMVIVGNEVTLDGTATDGGPFGNNIEFMWSQTTDDAVLVSLTKSRTAKPMFTVPGNTPVGTTLRFTLRVTGKGETVHGPNDPMDHLTTHDDVIVTAAARPNVAPEFTGAPSFAVNEGQTIVGTVTAEDANIEDEVTYSITGDADDALFTIDSSSGELSFVTAPDYENPAGMDNEYMLTVTASGGTDARALTTTQAITVTVLDVAMTVTLTAGEPVVTEGESAVFTLSRTDATDAPALTVNITVDDSDGALAAAPPNTVTFDAGSATTILSLATDDDMLDEPDSILTVDIISISGVGYEDVSRGPISVVVTDNDVTFIEEIAPGGPNGFIVDIGAADYVIISGRHNDGARINADVLLPNMFGSSLRTCIVYGFPENEPTNVEECDSLHGSLIEEPIVQVPVFGSVLYGVDVEDDGGVTTVRESLRIYVAPPTGFPSEVRWRHFPGPAPIDMLLLTSDNDGVPESIDFDFELGSGKRMVGPIDVSFAKGRSTVSISLSSEENVVRLSKINGVAFSGRRDDDLSMVTEAMLRDNKLFSLGNNEIEFVGAEESDESPIESVEPVVSLPELVTFDQVTTITLTGDYIVNVFAYATATATFDQVGMSEDVVRGVVIDISNDDTIRSFDNRGMERIISFDDADFSPHIFQVEISTNMEVIATINALGDVATDLGNASTEQLTLATRGELMPGFYAYKNVFNLPPLPDGREVSDPEIEVFDFIVTDFPAGVATIVIKLVAPTQEGSLYYRYRRSEDELTDDWVPFEAGDIDKIFSAPAPCPSAQASRETNASIGQSDYAWHLASSGTRASDQCLMLEIEDGSVNDADGRVNGIIFSTGASVGVADDGDTDDGRRRGGGGAIGLWWLLLLVGIVSGAAALKRRDEGFNP